MVEPITFDYKNPSGGYVYDSRGNPIKKATVTAVKGTSPISVTTNAQCFYNFNGDLLGKGIYTMTVRKDGYRDLSFTAEVNEHGVLMAKPVTLKSNSIVFAINAKTSNNIKGKPDYHVKYSGSIPLVHGYDKAGSYKLYCTIEAEVNGKVLKSSTNAQINITE